MKVNKLNTLRSIKVKSVNDISKNILMVIGFLLLLTVVVFVPFPLLGLFILPGVIIKGADGDTISGGILFFIVGSLYSVWIYDHMWS